MTQDFSLRGPFWIGELPSSSLLGYNSPQLHSDLHSAIYYWLWEKYHISGLMTLRITVTTPNRWQFANLFPDQIFMSDFPPSALSLVSPWEIASSWIQNWGRTSNCTKKPFKDPWNLISRSERKNTLDFPWGELRYIDFYKFLPGSERALSWPI